MIVHEAADPPVPVQAIGGPAVADQEQGRRTITYFVNGERQTT